MISNLGNVYNTATNQLMAMSSTIQGDYKVTLVNSDKRVTRSVRVLVAEAFVPKPYIDGGAESQYLCDTVIVKDGVKHHVSADNLAWRPHWFAHKYARQFQSVYPDHFYNRKVRNIDKDVVYSSVLECGTKEGLLFDDIVRSCAAGDWVYPTGHCYEYV